MATSERKPLHEWFRTNAERDAREALRSALVDGREAREFYEQAGRALELTFKAVLASIDPHLILDRRVELSKRLEFARSDLGWSDMALSLQSLSMGELLTHIGLVVPEVGAKAKPKDGPLRLLVNHRNAVQHFGDCSDAALDKHVVAFIEALHHCYENRGWDLSDGLTQDLHEIAMSEWRGSRSEALVIAKIAMDRARRRLDSLRADTAESMLDSIAERWTVDRLQDYEEYAPAHCPICERPAIVHGWVDLETEFEPDSEYHSGGFVIHARMHAATFECVVCRLRLDDDEIQAAGVEFDEVYDLDGAAHDDYVEGIYEDMAADLYER